MFKLLLADIVAVLLHEAERPQNEHPHTKGLSTHASYFANSNHSPNPNPSSLSGKTTVSCITLVYGIANRLLDKNTSHTGVISYDLSIEIIFFKVITYLEIIYELSARSPDSLLHALFACFTCSALFQL